MITVAAVIARAPSPEKNHPHRQSLPATSPYSTTAITPSQQSPPTKSKLPFHFSSPLIAMLVVIATALLVITYSRLISRFLLRLLRRWQRWRRRRYLVPSSNGDVLDSPPPLFDSPEGFHFFSPCGLDESVIKTLPLSVYTTKSNSFHKKRNNGGDCSVCLLEFEENDCVRTLPLCSHAFHVDCIDIWLRSHANCPVCRAGIFRPESPFIPVMAARIRPSLEDTILHSITFEPVIQTPPHATTATTVTEITPCSEEPSPRPNSCTLNYNYSNSEDRLNDDGRDFLLKRSYSFGFERSVASERILVTEPVTVSPGRYRKGSFWSKRLSPFAPSSRSRVFSLRHHRGMKSPFFRRRGGFFPLSERFSSGRGGVGGESSGRSKSTMSPGFLRPSGASFSSSRLRCGDPEALLSPERFNRR
uniref:RING-type E3 ubiquitin transferase n=1 Tax=Rhizophora mucronata TaxID=61149 RepID=A0A2P2J910_RHIMU